MGHGVAKDELVAVRETEQASLARADAGNDSEWPIHSADWPVSEEPGVGRLLINWILVVCNPCKTIGFG